MDQSYCREFYWGGIEIEIEEKGYVFWIGTPFLCDLTIRTGFAVGGILMNAISALGMIQALGMSHARDRVVRIGMWIAYEGAGYYGYRKLNEIEREVMKEREIQMDLVFYVAMTIMNGMVIKLVMGVEEEERRRKVN